MTKSYTQTKIWPKILTASGLTALLLATLLYTSLAQGPDAEHVHNVSRTAAANLDSSRPQMASLSDTLVIVWSEGASSAKLVNNRGNIYLQSASETDAFWRPTIRVHTSTVESSSSLTDLGADPKFVFGQALSPTQTHIVHLVWSNGLFTTGGGGENISFPEIQYTWCDVSNIWNTCAAPVTVAITGTANDPDFSSPTIAQDDQGNLHVVWVNNTDPQSSILLYSRSADGLNWSAGQVITDADAAKGQSPQLLFANGRLHLVWDKDDSATAGNNAIEYRYDDNLDDDFFTPATTGKSWKTTSNGFGQCFNDGDPGNPTLTALPALNLLYAAFDIQPADPVPAICPSAADDGGFTLIYASSKNNGGTGSDWNTPFGVTENSTDYFSNIYPSDNQPTSGGLKPTLAISYTGVPTWSSVKLHTLWHNKDGLTPSTYQIYYAAGNIKDSGVISTPDWNPPSGTPINVTVPDTRKTVEAKTAADVLCDATSNFDDSAGSALVVTGKSAGGEGNAHAAYQERPGNSAEKWDVCYKGVIAGTVDPDYIQNPALFNLSISVEPKKIQTSSLTYPPLDLSYEMTIANTGDLNVVGLMITNTLPGQTFTVTEVTLDPASPGQVSNDLAAINSSKVFTWAGDIAIDETVTINFSLQTTELPVPSTMRNKVQLWNKHLGSPPVLITKWANASVTTFKIYLPLIFKNSLYLVIRY